MSLRAFNDDKNHHINLSVFKCNYLALKTGRGTNSLSKPVRGTMKVQISSKQTNIIYKQTVSITTMKAPKFGAFCLFSRILLFGCLS